MNRHGTRLTAPISHVHQGGGSLRLSVFQGGRQWRFPLATAAVLALFLAGCEPTVRVEAPKDPIVINLNIKLDADVRLRVEEKAKEDVETKAIF